MIDPRELRPGNYIKWQSTGDIEQVQDIKISQLKTPTINNVSIKDAEPIKLTEQWLIDFNCVRLGSAFSYDINKHCRLSIYPESGIYHLELQALNIDTGADEIETFVTLNSIKYVHSFQNLIFSLTGKELTKQ